MGRPPPPPAELIARLSGSTTFKTAPNIHELPAIVDRIDALRRAMEAKALELVLGARQRMKDARLQQHNVQEALFHVGDTVLVSVASWPHIPAGVSKVSPRWAGPATVLSQVHPLLYKIRFLGT